MNEKWKTSSLPPEQMEAVLEEEHSEHYAIVAATQLEDGTSVIVIKGDFNRMEVPKEWFISGCYEIPDFDSLEIIDGGQTLSFGSYEVGVETMLNEFDPSYLGRLYQKPFLEKCIEGEVEPEVIEDYVDRWHKRQMPWKQRGWTLGEFLGMTEEEYQKWVEEDSCLPEIIRKRKEKL